MIFLVKGIKRKKPTKSVKKPGIINSKAAIALVFLTAIIGVYFAKIQGIKTLRSGMVNLYQNKLLRLARK